MCVSKGIAAARLMEAVTLGFGPLGENRVQEAETKAGLVAGAEWHLVGRLQANKAARAVGLFSVIHSVDSLALARRLGRLSGEAGRRLPVYLQVNVDDDTAKSGFDPTDLEDCLPEILSLPDLGVVGLMTVGRQVTRAEDARPTFVRSRQLSERLRTAQPLLGAGLSMGMSDDFTVAIEEGATVVRVGRALFGRRPEPASHDWQRPA